MSGRERARVESSPSASLIGGKRRHQIRILIVLFLGELSENCSTRDPLEKFGARVCEQMERGRIVSGISCCGQNLCGLEPRFSIVLDVRKL